MACVFTQSTTTETCRSCIVVVGAAVHFFKGTTTTKRTVVQSTTTDKSNGCIVVAGAAVAKCTAVQSTANGKCTRGLCKRTAVGFFNRTTTTASHTDV